MIESTGACSAGQCSTSSVSIASPCQGDRHSSPSVNKVEGHGEAQGHSGYVQQVPDNVHTCVSGVASHGEGRGVINPTGLHNIQPSNAEIQPWPGSCGGESETLCCAVGIVGSCSQI